MRASSNRNRIRQSWQPSRLDGAPAKAWLIARRLTASLVAVGLVGWCLFLLVQWVSSEKTYFVYLTASAYRPGKGWPISYVNRDFVALQKLGDVFSKCEVVDPFAEPLTKRLLLTRVSGNPEWKIRSKDTLLVYLTAHGVVQGKTAYLLCETEEGDDEEALLSIADVLETLKQVPAQTKVLVLDAGREGSNSRLGPIINTFPKLLDEAVQKVRDPNLWVLSANDSFERSHVSPALHRSVMGIVLSTGLHGDADLNGDRQIALDELVRYVRMQVSNWVKQVTSNNESQTPQLMHCDPNRLSAAPILIASHAPQLPTLPKIGPGAAHAEEHSKPQIWTMVSEDLKGIVPLHLRELAEHMVGEGHEGGDGHGSEGEHSAVDEHGAGEDHKSGESEGESPTTNNVAGFVQVKLLDAWKGSAVVEGAADRSAPSVFVPPLWRELTDQLLWYEQFCTVEVPDDKKKAWKDVIDPLNGINRSLRDFAKQSVAKPRAENIVERIRARSFATPLPAGTTRPSSLALLQLMAANDPGRPLPEDLKVFAEKYRALIIKEDSKPKDLDAILEKTEALELVKLYEFQLLDLRNDSGLSWETLRLLLLVRLRGEQAAADLLCGEGWTRKSIEAADRARSAGERMVFDRTDPNWEATSKTKFNDALARYEQAIKELGLIRATIQERNKLLARLPEYLRLFHRSRVEIPAENLRRIRPSDLIELATEINSALVEPSGEGLPRNFAELSQQLHAALEAIETPEETADNPVRMASFLATALPTPERRLELKEELFKLDKKALPGPNDSQKEPSAPLREITSTQWREIMEHLEIELGLAQLAGSEGEKVEVLEAIRNASESERWDKLHEVSDRLGQLYGTLPKRLKAIPESGSLADAAMRPMRLAELRRATQSWLLLGPMPSEEPQVSLDLSAKLVRAAWYDLLCWQFQRFSRAAVDVPPKQHADLMGLATEFATLAGGVPDQPPFAPAAQPQVTIEAESVVSLEVHNEVQINVTVKSLSSARNPLWLFAQFNRNLLEVSGAYTQDKLDPVENEAYSTAIESREINFATLLRQRRLEPSAQIPAGGSQRFTLKVKRRGNAAGTTSLIVKAVAGTSLVRHDADILLPGRDELLLTVGLENEFWQHTNQGIRLLPLPGHVQSFPLRLANRTKVEKKVKVSFYNPLDLPDNDGTLILPFGALSRDDADMLLDRFKPAKLGPDFPEFAVVLPAMGKSIRLQVPDAKPANLLPLPPPTSDDKTPKVPLRHGLLVKLEDQTSGLVTIRQIEIAPQRPHGYLTATANYDVATRQLEIVVQAPNANMVPPEGFKVATNAEGVSRQFSQKLVAELRPPDANSSDNPNSAYTARMFARLLANQPEIKASVDVDGYPRAFIFRMRGSESHRNAEPLDNTHEVRVVRPEPKTPFQAPRDTIPVTVQIDAPKSSFGYQDRTSFVEIGLDTNRNGELEDEYIPRVKKYSDRQVTIDATGFSTDGTLTLNTKVDDFRDLPVPATGLMNVSVYALARLHTTSGSNDQWSNRVEICLDGAGPSISAELNPGQPSRDVEFGKDLEVLVSPDPNAPDLSGIKKVEVAFDLAATGDEKNAKWEEAKRIETGWFAKLPTKDLVPGRYTVLFRVTDLVGNIDDQHEESVELLKKPEPAPAIKPVKDVSNTLTGEVKYGTEVGGKVDIWLQDENGTVLPAVKTDANGHYRMSKIKPGKYRVLAKGVVRARMRQGEASITIVPFPQVQASANIDLH